jgi:Uma2 family endonuclease
MIQKAAFNPFVLNEYPTSDGRPMAETDFHRDLMNQLIDTLSRWFAPDPWVYVSGNLLVFYDEGNKRKHIAPDVFVVKGVPRGQRPNYLIWKEGKAPEVVIELTSRTTRSEDTTTKMDLYRNTLKVREYFLFDPFEEYLYPSMQGYRRVKDRFHAIKPVDGRLPSRVLGLHLARVGEYLRLWNPDSRVWLRSAAEQLSETERALLATEEARAAAEEARVASDAESERLRREIEELRRKLANGK